MEYDFGNLGVVVKDNGEYDYGYGFSFGKKHEKLAYTMVNSPVNHKNYYVHRLVAIAFVRNPAPTELKHVDHIDQNKLNNAASNLRWVTPALNNLNRPTKNYEYQKRYKNYRVRVTYKDKITALGWYQTAEEAQQITNAWKAIRFRCEFLSYVKNDLSYWHSQDRRGYLSADKSVFAERVKFVNSRVKRHRTLRKALRLLLADNPSATVAIQF